MHACSTQYLMAPARFEILPVVTRLLRALLADGQHYDSSTSASLRGCLRRRDVKVNTIRPSIRCLRDG